MSHRYNTLILGIGNTLLSDEGIGIHVLNELQQSRRLNGNVNYLDGGTLSFTLADPIQSCDQLIVVDASELSKAPGEIAVFENEDMDRFVTSGNKKSPHEVGLVDVLAISLLGGHLPAQRALVGIQPESLDWGNAPTPAVAAAIPEACRQITNLVAKWQV